MYTVTAMNEKGVRFEKEFSNPYQMNKYINKVKRSKKLVYIGYTKSF